MTKSDVHAVSQFKKGIGSLHQLMQFDDLVLQFVINPLERLNARQEKAKIQPHLRPVGLLKILGNIKTNQSLKRYYEVMYNQCLVLLVSHFASATRQLFIDAVAAAIEDGTVPKLLDVKLQMSPRELRESAQSTSQLLAEALSNAKDVSFQDMQSIERTFREYFGGNAKKDSRINDIIVGQACRHAIVHNGSLIDRRLLNQLRGAQPRSVKPDLNDGERLRFSREEVQEIARAMHGYLRDLAATIEAGGTRLPHETAV